VTLPGVVVINADARPPSRPRLSLSTAFLVGETEFGPQTAVLSRTKREFERSHGARTLTTTAMHDWVTEFFAEGGTALYTSRLVGPGAAAASHVFLDGTSAPSLTVRALSVGEYGNRLSVDIDVSGSNFEVKVYLDGTTDADIVERSGLVATPAAAALWGADAKYVRVTAGVGTDPVATSPVALTGGDDDLDGVTGTEITAALNKFGAGLGPGSVVLPGRTATASQLLAAAHAAANNRLARLDAAQVASASTIASQAATLRASGYADVCDLLAPSLTIPGLAPGTTRTVPASALRCGVEARNDALGISPNQPAAGKWGIAHYATAPTVEWDDDDREMLNDAGVTVVRVIDGDVRIYGSRTLADPATDPAALRLGSARLRMALTEIARFQAEQIEFAELDQGGVVLGDHVGLVRSAIKRYAQSLYFLDVTAQVVEDDLQDGVYLVETAVEFQAAPDAERVRVVITRSVTEV
jgi:hypothetical protein